MPLAGDQVRPTESASPVETAETVAVLPAPAEPVASAQPAPLPAQSVPPQEIPAPAPQPAAPDPAPIPQTPPPAPTPQDSGNPEQPELAAPTPADFTGDTLSWEAEEFAHNAKSSQWYSLAIVAALAISVIVYFINRDIITAVIVFFAIIGLAFFSGRQPRVQQYSLSVQGVQVGSRWYDFADFQGFSIVADGPAARSILLIPLKRFMPLITINLPPDQEDAAADILGSVLPMQQRQGDPVDRFMRRLKF